MASDERQETVEDVLEKWRDKETIKDIIDNKRRIAKEIRDNAINGDYWDKREAKEEADELEYEADRIEAAWKRERESLLTKQGENVNSGSAVYTGENNGGNAAAMREALEAFVEYSELVCRMGMFNRDSLFAITTKARAALSAPRRQCDVGTAEQQAERMRRKFCAKQKRDGIIDCSLCPIRHAYRRDCTLAWAQMPYEAERKGECDGR